jgi:hypothetical protein
MWMHLCAPALDASASICSVTRETGVLLPICAGFDRTSEQGYTPHRYAFHPSLCCDGPHPPQHPDTYTPIVYTDWDVAPAHQARCRRQP